MDNDGNTPLLQSVFSQADDVTQLLLFREATFTNWGSCGLILHYVALSGGLRTLAILLAARLQGIDPDILNREGKTPLQLTQEREVKEHGSMVKF